MNASMVIRIAASLTELKRNLQEGRDQIEVTTAGMKKLATSLEGNKLIQHAHNIAAAIKEVGGVTKLTEAEKARLNVTLQKAIDKYKALGKEAPTALKALAEATKKPTASMFSLDTAVGKVAATVAATFTVGAVIGAIKSAGQWAGRIDDLSKKMGISVEAVQRLDHAAKQNGSSIEAVGSAIAQMSKRLVEGDSSAVGALDKLGVSLHALRAQAPDRAFATLATAIADVPDPMERSAIAMQLFGRSGADLLPMMGSLERDMANAVVANKAMIEAGDRLGDSWDKLTTVGTGFLAAALVPLEPALTAAANATGRLVQQQFDLMEAADRATVALRDQRAEAMKPRISPLPSFTERLRNASGFAGGPDVALLRQLAGVERDRMLAMAQSPTFGGFGGLMPEPFDPLGGQSQAFIERTLDAAIKKTRQQADAAREATAAYGQMRGEITKIHDELNKLPTARLDAQTMRLMTEGVGAGGFLPGGGLAFNAGLRNVRFQERVSEMGLFSAPKPLVDEASRMRQKGFGGILGQSGLFSGLKGGFSNVLQGLTGGKGVGGFLSNIGGGISQGFGNLISGGISSAIGMGLNFAMKGLGKLFGFGPSAAKQTADMRKQWLDQIGDVNKFRDAAEKAGVSVDRIFNAKKPKDFEAAVASVTAQITAQQERQQRLNSVAERYGVTIDQYGRKFRQQQLNEQIQSLMEDYRDLLDLTEDVVLSTEKIAPAVNEYLRIAIRTGAEVPVSLRPIIQRMQEMGLLAEDNAEKLGDITWAETMSQGFDRVVEAVNRLTDALTGAAEAAAQITVPAIPGDGGGGVPGTGEAIPQMHRGGLVRRAHNGWYVHRGGLSSDEVRIIAQTGEGVLSRQGMAAFDALNQGRVPSGGAPSGQLEAEVRGLRADLNRLFDILPGQFQAAAQIARGRGVTRG